MENDTKKITTRSRCLGYGASGNVVDVYNPTTGQTSWGIEPPSEAVTGGLATIERERAEYQRIYDPSTAWRESLFVGGRRVVGADLGMVLWELREFGYTTVELEANP
jgi:hypothetical protein